jgi:hypothetical protein
MAWSIGSTYSYLNFQIWASLRTYAFVNAPPKKRMKICLTAFEWMRTRARIGKCTGKKGVHNAWASVAGLSGTVYPGRF